MKRNIILIQLFIVTFFYSCNNLDLNPLSEGSTENWYSTETEIEMALNELYRVDYWPKGNEYWTDDMTGRETNHEIVNGTFNGQSPEATSLWTSMYAGIARANVLLEKMDKAADLGFSQTKIDRFKAEAYFARASFYSNLISYFGDVVYLTEVVDIEKAFTLGRSPKSEIVPKVYEDFDKAIKDLPETYGTASLQRATKGAALALKARFALYIGDWRMAAESAKGCMDLNIYKLHPDFSNLFLTNTKNSVESVFMLPRSIEFDVTIHYTTGLATITRNAGGWAQYNPSWDLLASFLCRDGLPIDESPLFNSKKPFENRDPRCAATIVEFGTRHLGFTYDPHPNTLQVMNFNTGRMQTNNDTRANAQYASFNGLVWKKGVDEEYLKNGNKPTPDNIIIRYADVLLMYAESKIELNEIDQTVLDAINSVRARAYGVDKSSTANYPSVVMVPQNQLRNIIRIERRMEFAYEGLRYMDLVRWRLATKALNSKNYGLLYPASLLREKVVNPGLWFWPSTPQIDENGLSDFSQMENAGQIAVLSQRSWNDRQYLWPIPTKEILINENLTQNPDY